MGKAAPGGSARLPCLRQQTGLERYSIPAKLIAVAVTIALSIISLSHFKIIILMKLYFAHGSDKLDFSAITSLIALASPVQRA